MCSEFVLEILVGLCRPLLTRTPAAFLFALLLLQSAFASINPPLRSPLCPPHAALPCRPPVRPCNLTLATPRSQLLLLPAEHTPNPPSLLACGPMQQGLQYAIDTICSTLQGHTPPCATSVLAMRPAERREAGDHARLFGRAATRYQRAVASCCSAARFSLTICLPSPFKCERRKGASRGGGAAS